MTKCYLGGRVEIEGEQGTDYLNCQDNRFVTLVTKLFSGALRGAIIKLSSRIHQGPINITLIGKAPLQKRKRHFSAQCSCWFMVCSISYFYSLSFATWIGQQTAAWNIAILHVPPAYPSTLYIINKSELIKSSKQAHWHWEKYNVTNGYFLCWSVRNCTIWNVEIDCKKGLQEPQ